MAQKVEIFMGFATANCRAYFSLLLQLLVGESPSLAAQA